MKKVKWNKLTGMVAILGTSALLLGACGSDTAEAEDASTATSISESETPTLDAIKESGKLTVATGTYVPFEYRDPDTDEIIGYDIDFAQILADKLDVELEVTDMQFTSIIPSVVKGDYDLAIAAMYDTPERREQVLMSDSYLETGMVLVTQTGQHQDIESLEDAEGLRVGVKTGATSEKIAQEAMAEYGINYEIIGYDETVGAILDLEAGRVDVVVNDLLNQLEINKTHDAVEIATEPFTESNLSIAVQQGNEDLMDFINETIKEYKADGTKDELYKKWVE